MASTDFDSGILSFDQLIHQLPAVSLEFGSLTVDAGFGNSFLHNNHGKGTTLGQIAEPVVQHGPFVMNTREEIDQAIREYREGTLLEA